MTAPTSDKAYRLLMVERRLGALTAAMPDVLKLTANCAQQASTIARLLGENDALRRNEQKLKDYVAELHGRMKGWPI